LGLFGRYSNILSGMCLSPCVARSGARHREEESADAEEEQKVAPRNREKRKISSISIVGLLCLLVITSP
jgi:hypothetical protein